jgi:Acetyltransferase (GNAT) domain
MQDFQIIPVTKDIDLASLVALASLCFKMNVGEDYFRWKYFDNPAGDAIAYAAMVDGKIVASYGMIPEYYWVNGEVTKIFQAIDAMTHPDFRNSGIFMTLATCCQEEIKRLGIESVSFAFPAKKSYGVFTQKLGWKPKFDFKLWFCYDVQFNIWPVRGNRGPARVSLVPALHNERDLATYFENKRPGHPIEKYFDLNIFKWKIIENRHKKLEMVWIYRNTLLVGLAGFHLDSLKSCHLVWLDFLNKEDFSSSTVTQVLKYLFLVTKRRCIYTWSPLASFDRRILSRSGFLRNAFRVGPFKERFDFIMWANEKNPSEWWEKRSNYCFQGIMLD